MKFEICSTRKRFGGTLEKKYKDSLAEIGITVKNSYDKHSEKKISVVEINDIEKLIKISDLGHEGIVISNDLFPDSLPRIEIYDDYRE